MSIADDLVKLEELRRGGALTEEEFARAKEAVLAGDARPDVLIDGDQAGAALAGHLSEVREQNELARIDREWEMERERYMVHGRYGRRDIPTPVGSIVMALVVGGFGVFWTVMAFSMSSGFPDEGPMPLFKTCFPLFGVLFTVGGVVQAVRAYNKANQYRQAEAAYRARRARAAGGRPR